MPFLDHLEELRWRIIYGLGALMVGLVIGFVVVVKFDLISLLQKPVLPFLRGNTLVITSPGAGFSIALQLAFIVGVAFALPVIAYQIWAFLSPALHKHERRIVIPILLAATLLFVGGASLAYFIVKFFDLWTANLTPMYTVTEYFGLVTSLCLTFGLAFEVPIMLVGLSAFGIISPQALGRMRRWAVLVVMIGSAVITPGDFIGATFAMAIPLYILYEMSVAVSWLIYRKQEKRRAAELADESGALA
jgi:sec-independent protein translocase protein TatC